MGFKVKLCLFFAMLIIDIADLASDWLLYTDVVQTERGLVFGQFDEHLVRALLVFCSVGTVIFVVESIVYALDLWEKCSKLAPDIVTCIAVWVEEVPQMIINIIIVACRDEAVSVFQVSKASVCIVGALLRFIITFVNYCRQKRKDDGSDKALHGCVQTKCFTIPGLILAVILSGLVFYGSNFTYENGTIKFHHPRNLFDGEYMMKDKYLQGVGVFANFHPVETGSQPAMMADDQWIKLARVRYIGPEDSAQMIKLKYGVLQDGRQILQIQSGVAIDFTNKRNLDTECYQRMTITRQIQPISTQNCSTLLQTANTTSAIFRFNFIENNKHLIMGDIHYNYRRFENGDCQSTTYTGQILGPIKYQLKYMKLESNDDEKHLAIQEDNTAEFFSQDSGNLKDVKDVWKTGFFNCESTGRLSPKLDAGIEVPCH